MKKAFTLIEMVVAVGVFALLATGVSLALSSTLRGARKAAANNLVRSEGAYAVSVMTQKLKFAKEITTCGGNVVTFIDFQNSAVEYDCSSKATLSLSSKVDIMTNPACIISCVPAFPLQLERVDIRFGLVPAGVNPGTVEFSSIIFDTQVVLRNQ